MLSDTGIRTRPKHRGEPVVEKAGPVESSRHCLGCRWFVADLDNNRRRCTHTESPHYNKRIMTGCGQWKQFKQGK